MRLKLALAVLILILGGFTSATPQAGAASPEELAQKIEQTRRERDALLAEQKRLQVELETVSRQGSSLASAVKSLDATRSKLAADISVTQSKISTTNLNIQMLENSLDQKGKQIALHTEAIAATIQALADHDTRPLVLDILSSDRLSDVWDISDNLSDLSSKLYEEINLLRETRQVLNTEKEITEKTVEELASLQDQLGGQKQVIEQNKLAQERLLQETKNKEAEYQRMLAENIARQKQFEDELYRFESELRVALDPSLIPASRPGLLSWPLDQVFITQRFGKTSASGRLYASGSHNGVDFRAPMGTPVRAMLAGTIEGVGNTDEQRGCYSYGRWILIKHPNGLSTIYAHLSASMVQKGQTVNTGDVIAYSGGTPRTDGAGYSTGPHLHVGLFASQGVQVRQFTTSINCKQVFVPMADAKAYLDPLVYLPGAN